MCSRLIHQSMIPFIPNQVAPDQIGSNGKLLTDKEINSLKLTFNANGRYSKVETGLSYSIYVQNGSYYAIYLGARHKAFGEFGKALGIGTYGKVKLAQNLDTGEWCVLKLQHAESNTADELSALFKSSQLCVDSDGQPVAFDRLVLSGRVRKNFFLKYAAGTELYSLLTFNADFSSRFWLEICLQSAKALDALHAQGILHRDVKPEHIFYNRLTNQAVLIDFGFAKTMDDKGYYHDVDYVGTPGFIAPECRRHYEYSKKSDIYSLGFSLSELLGLVKLSGDDIEFFSFYDHDSVNFNNNLLIKDANIRKSVALFLQKMTNDNPVCRPSGEEVIAFFNKQIAMLSGEDKYFRVGILDIDEYKKVKENPIDFKQLINNLRKVDEVQLVVGAFSLDDVAEYAAIKQDLCKHFLIVRSRMLYPALRRSFIPHIPDYFISTEKSNEFCFYHVGLNGLYKLDEKPFTEQTTSSIQFFSAHPNKSGHNTNQHDIRTNMKHG